MKDRGVIFVVSAPSGCGKTTLCNKLLAEKGLGLANSVSMTTRLPRRGEREGVDYYFVTKNKFKSIIKKDGFLEYENNFGNLYGTPRQLVEDKLRMGSPVLLSIDVKGAMKVRAAYPKESVLVFIVPPSIAELKKRLHTRHADTKKVIAKRLEIAKKELSYKNKYDRRIVNDKLDSAYKRLKKIVISKIGTIKGI